MARDPHAIAVDGGSTDAGAYYLGFEPSVSGHRDGAFRRFISKDLGPLLEAACDARIPLLVGSAGFAGGDIHVAGTVAIAFEEARRRGLDFTLATIGAELIPEHVIDQIRAGRVMPLGPAPTLTVEAVEASVRLVGQMGVEPFIEALERGADVVIAGRANDPSMFAALPILRGFDRGLALHMAKILECGAIAAEPGSGSDMLLGTLREDHFLLEPINPARRCTVASVAAHSLYEKTDPTRLFGPGYIVELDDVHFEQVGPRKVRVSGSRFVENPHYQVKIEGARRVGFRTVCVSGIRDPGVISALDDLLCGARADTTAAIPELADEACHLGFHRYGQDGVMGDRERHPAHSIHEVGLVIEAVAPTQALATAIVGHARSLLLHYGFPGRRSTAGNLAFPFSPQELPAGPVYGFSAYHLMDADDPAALFPVNTLRVGSSPASGRGRAGATPRVGAP
jgi:hypothetical protein